MEPAAKQYSCPVEVTLDVIGAKWGSVILAHLKERDLRYGELRRLMPGTSEKMLVQRLRALEAVGLVHRSVSDHVPPQTRYVLTARGRSLSPVLQALYDWGVGWAAEAGIEVGPPS